MPSARTAMHFRIHGMDCAEEVTVLRREVGPVVGGADRLSFDILNGKMSVDASDGTVCPESVLGAVRRAGLDAEVWREHAPAGTPEEARGRRSRALLTLASGAFTASGFVAHAALAGGVGSAVAADGAGFEHSVVPLAARVLFALGILTGICPVLPKAWLALRRPGPDMNLLMTVAVVGAVAIGEWFEASTVAFLFSLSLALEAWSVGRARRAVEALLDLAPPVVRLRRPDGGAEEVRPEQVPPGSLFEVRPGERIALDGTVAAGTSTVNQAPITGESVPVPKNPGDPVFAGTVNGEGALDVRSTKPAGDTTLAHILKMVGEAQSRRAPSEQWVERFARVYTPAVLAVAVAVALVPPLLLGGAWPDWFYRALVLLVIACPCALVISTPVSIVAALAAAARHGVLIKGGAFVEAPARLRAVAFDKTGTLTVGRPAVAEVLPLDGHSEAELLERVASLEARSEHPVGRAIVEHARERNVGIRPAADFQVVPGRGATGLFDGQPYWLGSHRYLEERGQETDEVHRQLEALSEAGRTVVVVGNARHVCGFVTLADSVRPGAKEAVRALHEAGVIHVALLTGDNETTARAVARETEMDEVRAELLPAEKVAAIESLSARFGLVAMVGDGVNDAPALARAGVGIAMGAAGTDAAIETADVALMGDDLSRLPWLIRHSRRTLTVIRQNVVFSLAVKALFVALTFAGYASLWAAIAADTGASLLVIFNGLRLLRAGGGVGGAATLAGPDARHDGTGR